MGFVTSLCVKKIGDQRWLLIDDLVYHTVILDGYFIAPRGFQTDFASIPRFFWSIYPPVDNYDPAAVIHDAAYGHALVTRDSIDAGTYRVELVKDWADKIFLEALLSCGVSPIRARLMYHAVSLFGSSHIHPLAANTVARSMIRINASSSRK